MPETAKLPSGPVSLSPIDSRLLAGVWGVALGASMMNPGVNSLGVSLPLFLVVGVFLSVVGYCSLVVPLVRLPRDLLWVALFYSAFLLYCYLNSIRPGLYTRTYLQSLTTLPGLAIISVLVLRITGRPMTIYRGLLGVVALAAVVTIFGANAGERASGVAEDPNHTAASLVLAVLIVLWKRPFQHLYFGRALENVAVLLFCAAIFFTGSRTGYAMLAAVLVLTLIKTKHRKSRYFLFFVFLGTAVLTPILRDSIGVSRVRAVQEYFQEGSDGPVGTSGKTLGTRLAALGVALDLFRENPISGSGIGRSKSIVMRRAYITHGTHSVYAWLIAELGGLGLVLFVAFLFAVGISIHKIQFEESRRREEGSAMFLYIGLLAMMIMGLSIELLIDKIFWVYLSFLFVERTFPRFQLAQTDTDRGYDWDTNT